ncbi:MAG: hypothetical protein AAGE59_26815 [Cyanobacteria bacterium P01_F01_bin.86]
MTIPVSFIVFAAALERIWGWINGFCQVGKALSHLVKLSTQQRNDA